MLLPDEKAEKSFDALPYVASDPSFGHRKQRRSYSMTAFYALVVLASCLGSSAIISATRSALMKSHHADKGLSWFTCPDVTDTLCAYLSVPLDYTDTKSNETVSLALRKYSATAPADKRLGSLFINPGGPGGSGHGFVSRVGKLLSVIVEGRYDILSWDPRSVNLTAPTLSCFETAGDAARYVRDLEHSGLAYDGRGVNGSAKEVRSWIYKLDGYLSALNGACEARGNKHMLRASSTAFVVRDMKSILEALEEEKLTYWGFSYGTILGATFSAMFPELVHRALLDGVSDSESYTNNMWEWGRSGMNDTMKTWRGFVESCADSGPKGCALAKGDDTGDSIEDRVYKVMEELRTKPVVVPVSKVGPGLVSSSDLTYVIFNMLYAPKLWPRAALAIAELENGNGTLLYEQANESNDMLDRKAPPDNVFHRPLGSPAYVDTTAAIMCGDSAYIEDRSIERLEHHVEELGKKSITGEIWAIWTGTCSRWTHKAIETYRGPWSVAAGLRKTNFPVLFFSQTADPVTPLSAAVHMSQSFGPESASLLIQHGYGHCSLAHPSLCTALAARKYFLEGVVPKYGTECHADPGFLFPHPDDKKLENPLSFVKPEDKAMKDLKEALKELSGEIGALSMRPAFGGSFW